jgi:methionyl aminopeptidase
VVIALKTPREIDKMRVAGRITAEAIEVARKLVAPGIRTIDLDDAVAAHIRERGGEAAFLGYRGFPASICVSVNEEVVHGIPSRRRLEEGDVVSVDVGVKYDGFYGDSASTVPCGEISPEARRLIETAERALELAIEAVKPGEKLSTISRTVQTYVESNGFAVVRAFVGHGIGANLHEEPQVPNYVSKSLLDFDVILQPGLALAIEPMVNVGTADTKTKKNGWTVVTRDHRLSAHVEHTVVVTETGHEVLTRLDRGGSARVA